MKKFEYKLLTISVVHLRKKQFQEELDNKFNKWGEEGWDLVKMEPISGGGMTYFSSTSDFLAVFKREKV
ncbi:MAG: hypothetical protein ACI8TA_003550 [Cyclobacteriaceae bacterium]|jgi:hypothetical protein